MAEVRDVAEFAFFEGQDRAELAEALGHLSFAAQRQFPRVGNEDFPTPWDVDHERINDLLTLWELAL